MEHTSKKLLQVVLDACEDKLAQEVVALDVASLTPVAEYFVITHAIPRPGEDARELFEMLHGLYCTFAVCSSEGRVLGCVDVVGPSGMTTANSNFKHEFLEQCSIAYCVLEPGAALPPAEELRQRFLGEGESSASDLVKLQQARKQLHRTLDQNRYFRNEGSAGAAWQQVDSFLAPMDSRSGTIRS